MSEDKIRTKLAGLDLVLNLAQANEQEVDYSPNILKLISSPSDPITLASQSFSQAVKHSGLRLDRVYSGTQDQQTVLKRTIKRTANIIKRINPGIDDQRRLVAASVGLEAIELGTNSYTSEDLLYEVFPQTIARQRKSLRSWTNEFESYRTNEFYEKKQKIFGRTLEKLLITSYLLDLHGNETTAEVSELVFDAYKLLKNYVENDSLLGRRNNQERISAELALIRAEKKSKGSVKSQIGKLQEELEGKCEEYDHPSSLSPLEKWYFTPRAFEKWREGLIYKCLGVKIFKLFIPETGTFAARRSNWRPIANAKTKEEGLRAYEPKTRNYESQHYSRMVYWPAVIGTCLYVSHCIPSPDPFHSLFKTLGVLATIAATLIDVYPIMLQRYNRARIYNALGKD